MKKPIAFIFMCCAGIAFLVTRSHFATAGIEDPPVCGTFAAGMVDEIPGGVAGGNPGINYSTGFEPGEGFPLGYISNTPGTHPAGCGGVAFPCWGHTTSNTCPSGAPGPVCTFSLATPSIETAHPASGVQHLRLEHDPTTRTNIPNFGLGVDARYPRTADLSARPVAPNTVSVDIAIRTYPKTSFSSRMVQLK